MAPKYTVPGISPEQSATVLDLLQQRLVALIDLQLTLKHVHWNVVGPNFIGIHEMLDPQVDAVRLMTDDVAERIATMGGEPLGTPGAVVKLRTWDDYDLNRQTTIAHLGALDMVYQGVIGDHRSAMATIEEIDFVTHDMLVEQSEQLELFHWFVRAHLENAGGEIATQGADTEQEAAAAASEAIDIE